MEAAKNKKIISFLISAVFLMTAAFGQNTIVTEGRGNTEEGARNSALQQMSQTFSSRVRSSTNATKNSVQNSDGSTKTISSLDMKVLVTSDMPLYGVTFNTTNNGLKGAAKEFTVTATLDPKKALPSYKTEIKKVVDKINSRVKGLEKISASKEEAEWQALAADYAYFDKLEMIFSVMEVTNEVQPSLSSADFRIKYEQHAAQINTLESAAEAIANGVQNFSSRIYVYPALFEGENTTTEFSTALANAVSAKLGRKVALTKSNSDSYLKGSYYFAPGSVDGEDIIVSYYLCKDDGSVIASSGMVKIPFKVYSPYKYVPRNYDLQREIDAGRTTNPEFDISIRINGDRNLQDFKAGDMLIIEARASSPCYIYVVSYVYNDEGNPFTYLLPLDIYADGKEQFVKKISAKEANTWVVLNPSMGNEVQAFEVMPPYGEETLHIFASTTDEFDSFVDQIPSYIETDDFYLVGGTPVQNVSKTRALNVKRVAKRAAKVVNTAESSVSYTTHK